MDMIDILIFAVLLTSALFAFKRGFSRGTITLFSWVATGAGTYFVFPIVAPLAHNAVPFPMVADVLALFVTFFGFLLALNLVGARFGRAVNSGTPGAIDRTLGFGYGLARGLVILSVCFWFFGFTSDTAEPPEWVARSSLFPLIDTTARQLTAFVPQTEGERPQGVASARERAYEAPTGEADETGYADSERNALDQLIESTSGD